MRDLQPDSYRRRGRAALLLTLAMIVMTVAPAQAGTGPTATDISPNTVSSMSDSATFAVTSSDFDKPFHFLEPLAPAAGDPANFDASLLDELVIEICRLEATDCVLVKTLTSQSSTSERLRIGTTGTDPSYYLAVWDTAKTKLVPHTYRVRVVAAGLELGSIDLAPAEYKSLGRTWPIKFLVENHPAVRTRILRSEDQSASQVANALRTEFGLDADSVAYYLANDIDPYPQDEIDLAIAGVFQAAMVPETTEIADAATHDVMTAYDPTTGTMAFSSLTPILNDLDVGDVFVSEPTAVAPNGLLRVVTSITELKKGDGVVIETRQASINEAITQGTLNAAGLLEPDDILSTEALPGVTLKEAPSATAMFGALDIGDGFDFHESIDVTFDGAVSGSGANGRGTVRIQGEMRFNAGYNVGFGVEECLDSPPFFTCVDRFEAHLGIDFDSDITVTGDFDGTLEKEVVLSTKHFKPIVFFIGPIPVVLVPVVKAMAGVKGDAHLDFSFEAQVSADLDVGAKWTDPDDGGEDWKNVSSEPNVTGVADGDLEATMELRAYARADAKILLYGIAGPGFAGNLGVGAKVQFPGNPLWQVFGHASGDINFAVDLGGILTLAEFREPLPEFKVVLKESDNRPPSCGARTDPIPVAVGAVTYLGPRGSGDLQGYFDCEDPEGDDPSYSARTLPDHIPVNLSAARWDEPGTHEIEITATDGAGTSTTFTITVEVINTPPILTATTPSASVPVSVQYFVSAYAYDVETGALLPCSSFSWSTTGGTATPTSDSRSCAASMVFTQTGSQSVTVRATDRHGKFSEQVVTVNVTAAPANAAPVIDPNSFKVWAERGPFTACGPDDFDCDTQYACPSGVFCRVPTGAVLHNGTVGDFHRPLTFSLSASDPNGDGITVTWHCSAGSTNFAVTDNGDGTFSCSPWSASATIPIRVWAEVSDGTTTVSSEVRTYVMLDRVG